VCSRTLIPRLATVIALNVPLAAAAGAPGATAVVITSWATADGVAPEVRAIVRDKGGYLWLGTAAGLLRFDGARFDHAEVLFNEIRLSTPVYSLLIGRRGDMWIGFGPRGGLGKLSLDTGEYQEYDALDGVPDGSVRAIWEARDGTLWVGAFGGLARFRDGKWNTLRASAGFPDFATVDVIREDRDGSLLVATNIGILRARTPATPFEPFAPERDVLALAETAHGFWVAGNGGLARLPRPIPDDQPLPPALRAARALALATNGENEIWLGTNGQGLLRSTTVASGPFAVDRFTVRDGLTSDTVFSLLKDSDGSLWVGTEDGLNRIVAGNTTLQSKVKSAYVASAAASADGGLWVGTNEGLFRIERDDTTATPYMAAGLAPDLSSMQVDTDGSVWVATAQGVVHVVEGRAIPLNGVGPNQLTRVHALGLDAIGRLWICDYEGLFRWHHGTLETVVNADSGRGRPGAMLKDRSNRLWVGFSLGDVALIRDNDISWFTPRDGLRPGGVNAFHEDDEGTLWIATNAGLSKFTNGRFVTFTRQHGLPDTGIRAVISDARRTLWVGGPSGIVGIDPRELEKAADDAGYRARYTLLDSADGLEGVVTRRALPNAVRRADGTLWFSTTRGFSVLNPNDVRPEVAPAIRIERVIADEHALTPSSAVRLPALTKRLQFTYTSVNLLTPQKTRFRYRLEGFDNNWIDAGQTRQAVYANLKPGSYRFVVTATQGQVAESTAALDVIVPPKYYQTTWFYVLCLCVGGGAGIDLWRRRLKKVHTRYSLVLAERGRLAREIHDTLLQGMVGVALQFHAILETLDSSPEQARRSLTRARDSLEHHIREARRSILDLRSPALEHVPFAEALRRTAHELAGWSQTDVSFVTTGKVQEFPRASEEQLLRIAQEAISNAVQHANATTISVELHYTDTGLTLRMSDDGTGFDPEDVKVKHWGLSSMKERATHIGASFHLSSSSQGTVVEVSVERAPAKAR